MYSVTMQTTARGVEASLSDLVSKLGGVYWRSAIMLPWMARRVIVNARKFNDSLASSNTRLMDLRRAVPFVDEKVIDPDFQLRDKLESIKSDVLNIRRRLVHIQGMLSPNDKFRLRARFDEAVGAEVARSIALCCEAFEIANGLQWDVAEHDADNSVRHEDFVASSADEVMQMLSRF
ncbi:hypothetical protein WI96_15995 [Burkholderia vietnamiensis]|uniref:hypothetical protein n=1 Tax=Burkholderia TaxID=32008 RepID=UPI00075A94CB|nr:MULTISPECIES: hypothetical protein [Burkholderia]KVE63967.1 hypothetical protein WI96_15995 [Burkholderia vietnamiensis]QMI46046.1 hypothetical protein MBR110_11640 [Burkholderia sp. MBR-1]